MLYRSCLTVTSRAVVYTRSSCAPQRVCLAAASAVAQQLQRWMPTRGLSDSAPAATQRKKPDWAPGTPARGRRQTIGEAFAAMQYHARGTRKVKASVLNHILARVTSEEELKYAFLGLKLFKKQGIDLQTKTGTLFVKACCKAGSPQAAVDALAEAREYGLDAQGAVSANRFNYLLSQLYRTGDTDTFVRAVADAWSRRQSLNWRSHVLIAKFEKEVKAKEEEAARVKAEEERGTSEAEEKARKEEEERELKAKEEAEEELKAKKEAEDQAARVREEEEQAKKAAEEAEDEARKKAEMEAATAQAEAAAAMAETEATAAEETAAPAAEDADASPPPADGAADAAASEAPDADTKR